MIVIVACLSVAGFVVTGIEKYLAFWKRGKGIADAEFKRQSYLHTLTAEEKQLLCGYILNDTKTQIFRVDDGVVNGLVRAGVVYLTSAEGTIDGHAYNIHDWAWNYLTLAEGLLTEGVPTNRDGDVLPYDNTGSPLGRFMNRFRR